MKVSYILRGAASFLCFYAGCVTAMTKDATEFEWFASESGPEHENSRL